MTFCAPSCMRRTDRQRSPRTITAAMSSNIAISITFTFTFALIQKKGFGRMDQQFVKADPETLCNRASVKSCNLMPPTPAQHCCKLTI
ncbi:hypothetical protein K440DRAFT_88948 [Wilcoxina mikolae CBS 423.85]|nr:hypothetical protein K440DRAFT_88948 [Wilcoxina mikolae CBS 423.85]